MQVFRNSISSPTLISSGFGLFLACCLSGCGNKTDAPSPPAALSASNVLARVGETHITLEQLQARARSGRQPHADLLEELIEEEVLYQQGVKAGLLEDPKVRSRIRNLVIGMLKEQQLNKPLSDTSVSSEEIQQYFQEHTNEFRVPARVRVSAVWMEATTPEQRATALQTLESLRDQLKSENRLFAELVQQYSQDRISKPRGGDMGWLVAGQPHRLFSPAAIDTILAMSEDKPWSIVNTTKGIALVHPTTCEPSRPQPFQLAAPKIGEKLRNEKRQAVQDAFRQRMQQGIRIQRFPDRIPARKTPPENPPPAVTR